VHGGSSLSWRRFISASAGSAWNDQRILNPLYLIHPATPVLRRFPRTAVFGSSAVRQRIKWEHPEGL
jgi:hypothetical protein